MDKCKCYYIRRYIKGWKDSSTPVYEREVGVCYGTKEKEECICDGDRTKCDFYPEIRKKALEETQEHKILEAIKLLSAVGYKIIKEK